MSLPRCFRGNAPLAQGPTDLQLCSFDPRFTTAAPDRRVCRHSPYRSPLVLRDSPAKTVNRPSVFEGGLTVEQGRQRQLVSVAREFLFADAIVEYSTKSRSRSRLATTNHPLIGSTSTGDRVEAARKQKHRPPTKSNQRILRLKIRHCSARRQQD